MGRKGGFTISPEQKEAMRLGRIRAYEERHKNDPVEEESEEKSASIIQVQIVGYAVDPDGPYAVPVFRSEVDYYKGRIFSSKSEALENYKKNNGRFHSAEPVIETKKETNQSLFGEDILNWVAELNKSNKEIE